MTYRPQDDPWHDGPEAWFAREQAEQEARDAAVVEHLLASLTPEDATAELFTFQERREWGLKHTRKRAKGANEGE